ncbi:aspartate carbamoyltransferase [Methylomonas albis]|uniref:Aspartate carbamoyltransferase n=1 Tax=Methylomonas albis TaxID=1854563 RepID=A0ABR9CWL8_9GAMM|nr:aspartate carbamoyltransferase [Methylomonas albis]MBD9355272.1 aspartate carbamoyltransferase [Methylomonas albis]
MKLSNEDVKLVCCLVLIVLVWGLLSPPALADDKVRQTEVAVRGAKVMPFSLAQTQHQFTKTETGGIQRVIVRDDLDLEQVWLIRQHLEQLADSFNRGDFSAPETIHGADMPGLAVMRSAKSGALRIYYTAEAAGASLTFASGVPELIAAVHDWFDAQLRDHGGDATAMHCPQHQ